MYITLWLNVYSMMKMFPFSSTFVHRFRGLADSSAQVTHWQWEEFWRLFPIFSPSRRSFRGNQIVSRRSLGECSPKYHSKWFPLLFSTASERAEADVGEWEGMHFCKQLWQLVILCVLEGSPCSHLVFWKVPPVATLMSQFLVSPEVWTVRFCCLDHSVCAALLWQP